MRGASVPYSDTQRRAIADNARLGERRLGSVFSRRQVLGIAEERAHDRQLSRAGGRFAEERADTRKNRHVSTMAARAAELQRPVLFLVQHAGNEASAGGEPLLVDVVLPVVVEAGEEDEAVALVQDVRPGKAPGGVEPDGVVARVTGEPLGVLVERLAEPTAALIGAEVEPFELAGRPLLRPYGDRTDNLAAELRDPESRALTRVALVGLGEVALEASMADANPCSASTWLTESRTTA